VTKPALIPIEGPREATGGGEWEPNQILLQEPTYVKSLNPKAKNYKNVMNIPTNSVEMIPLKLRMQWKKNGINRTHG
jgi:hypothetical protein